MRKPKPIKTIKTNRLIHGPMDGANLFLTEHFHKICCLYAKEESFHVYEKQGENYYYRGIEKVQN